MAEEDWNERQDDESLAKWLSEYGKMYFTNAEGKKTIVNDLASAKFFLNNRADVIHGENLLTKIRDKNDLKKVFIAGAKDGLLDVEILREDAEKGKFDFFAVENASHFVMIDEVEKVREIILEKFQGI